MLLKAPVRTWNYNQMQSSNKNVLCKHLHTPGTLHFPDLNNQYLDYFNSRQHLSSFHLLSTERFYKVYENQSPSEMIVAHYLGTSQAPLRAPGSQPDFFFFLPEVNLFLGIWHRSKFFHLVHPKKKVEEQTLQHVNSTPQDNYDDSSEKHHLCSSCTEKLHIKSLYDRIGL